MVALAVELSSTEYTDDQVICETTPSPTDGSLFAGYTYLCILARATVNGKNLEICFDTGTGRDLIDRNFVRQFDYTIYAVEGGYVRGFGSVPTRLWEYVEFSFYLLGKRISIDNDAVVKVMVKAWLVDALEVGCLIGNGWLYSRGI